MVLELSKENLYNQCSGKQPDIIVARDKTSDTSIHMVKVNDDRCNIEYQADLQVSGVDYVNKFIFDSTPKMEFQGEVITPFKWVPEDYLKLGDSKCFCSTDNEEAYINIPRTTDGKIDVEKIKASLQKASEMIKSQNASALEALNYGVYKEAINSTNLLNALLGPELALAIEKVAAAQGCELPDFISADISLFELLTEIGKLADGSLFNSFGTNLIEDLAEVKSVDAIKNDIEKQNASLDELINFNIENDNDVKKFLEAYLNVTGTTFSCEKIDRCYDLKKDENFTNDERFVAYASSCGTSINLVNAKKNEILTNVVYDAGLRYIIPTIIGKIQHPIAKGIAAILPTYISIAESVTQGCAEGDVVNKSNLTYENFINIIGEGGVRGFLVLLPTSGWGEKIFSHSKFMKNIFNPNKGTAFNNFFVKFLGSKPLKAGCNFSAAWLLSRSAELILPNITAKDGVVRALSPEYNIFKTVEGWIY